LCLVVWVSAEAAGSGRGRRDVYFNTGTRNYEWVLDADITACFDEIDHTALMGLVRRRIADKQVLALVKAFLKAGILTEFGQVRGTVTGTLKAVFCRRCWLISRCRCSTSISRGRGSQRSMHGRHENAVDWPTSSLSAMRMISW